MLRAPRPDDLLALPIPTDPRLSPDGRLIAFTVQVPTRVRDGYRHALWAVPTDGSAPARRLTIGAKHDRSPRFSPDGRTLAFLSDRRLVVEDMPGAPEDREDGVQVHLLPLDGGEARRLTDLPRGVEDFAWAPDGRRLVVVTTSHGATREQDARLRGRRLHTHAQDVRTSDYRYLDRLDYMLNGAGFTYDRVCHLWLVDAETGEARRLTEGRASDESPAWSPDGTRIAFVSNRHRDRDLVWQSDVHVVDAGNGAVTEVTGGARGVFDVPTWLPDGGTIAALGHRFPAAAGSRNDVWLFAADGSDAEADGGRNLSARHDLMPGSSMTSDVTVHEEARLATSPDGGSLIFTAPIEGSYELWRIATGDGAVERLTNDRHYVSGWDAARGTTIAYVRSSPTEPPDVWVLDGAGWTRGRGGARPHPSATSAPRRLTSLAGRALDGVALSEPVERSATVDGRRVQGWYLPPIAAGGGGGPQPAAAPLVVEIHGGPHSLYGWSPVWEFQVLAGAGIGVFCSNPRGSEGYGEAFNAANFRDWADGPMRDVLAGVDALVADGLADPDRLGVTGGSYGGYLTNWIVAKDRRFGAAVTCRSVADLSMLMLTGDISGGEFGRLEFGAAPWDDPDLYRELSPITHAAGVRTPLLIQHSERDIRTTVGQAEALFTVLRSLHRPVRLMRVPEETHELTRSGTPFRRVENLVQVRDWFVHFLVEGRRRLPPLPRDRAGK